MNRLVVKITLVVCCLIAAVSANAQVAQYKNVVEPFTRITVSNDFKVNVVKAEEYSVDITVNETLKEFVQASVTEGALNIFFEEKKVTAEIMKPFRGRNAPSPIFNVTVNVPSGISSISISDNVVLQEFENLADTSVFIIELSGNASVESAVISSSEVSISSTRKGSGNFVVKGNNLNLNAKGSAQIKLDQEVKESNINIATNTNLVVNGKCETMKFVSSGTSKSILNGSADYTRYQLSGSSSVNALNLQAKEANVEMTSICTLSQAASEWVFINIANGATLTYAGEPQIHINSIRNSSVLRYQANEK